MPLYLFICRCGESVEALKPVGTETVACVCGKQAQRRAIYAPQIGGRVRPPVDQRRISLRDFNEATAEMHYEHEKAEESAQRRLPSAPVFEEAKRRVKKLRAAGITDSLDYRPEYVR